jgi:hypothetical protein
VVAIAFVGRFPPETKGRSVEEITEAFADKAGRRDAAAKA